MSTSTPRTPAPGTKPMATSGSRNVASERATTVDANAGSSTPAPTHGPWTKACTLGARRARWMPALRVVRTTWAAAGSAAVPNSSRSPPLQNAGPSPLSTTRSTDGSTAPSWSAATSSSRIRVP